MANFLNSVDVDQTDLLMKFLNNRLKYGLILDDFSNTFLINHFLKSENYRDAAKTGILMMLQEENSVPIASEMALYSTLNYIMSENAQESPWDPIPEIVEPEPEEEVKIRVEELENPDFDDHFDLVKKEHLLGKTLAFTAEGQKIDDSIIRNSLRLLGYAYYEKWSRVEEVLSESKEFSKSVLEQAAKYANSVGHELGQVSH